MKGHEIVVDGDFLGIQQDSTYREVWEALKRTGITRDAVLFSNSVIVAFGENTLRYFKDRAYGRCDFKSDPPPEYPICGS